MGKNIKNAIKSTVIGLAMLTSFYGGYHFLTNDVKSELKLKQLPAYTKAISLYKEIISPLHRTIDELNYIPKGGATILFTHTFREERYPNPKNAKKIINGVLKKLGDKDNLDDRLEIIYDSLPDQNDIRKYKRKHVDNYTFTYQKTSIENIIGDIKRLRNDYINKIPNDLRSKAEKERGLNYNLMLLNTLICASCAAYLLTKLQDS